MKFTYYGHATFAIETGGKNLLFDPFITPNPLAKDIDIDKIEADYILLSHGHTDHIADAVSLAKQTGATVIAMAEMTGWIEQQGITKVHGMNYGVYDFDFGRVRMVPAWHSSSLPDGSYGGNPAGFVVTTKEGSFYYSGDTCLMLEMQLIPHYTKLDFAVLPIGGNYTMNADDAVKAAEFIECNRVVGVHYNTFPPIAINVEEAVKVFASAGKELILMGIGESIEV